MTRDVERRPTPGGGVQQIALRGFVISIVATAIAGIVALLSPDFGEVQAKILGTTAAFAAASLNSLASASAWSRRRVLGYLPALGVALSIVALALAVFGIWAESDWDDLWKSVATVTVIAISASHASLLFRVHMVRAATIVAGLAVASAVSLAVLIIVLIWGGDGGEGSARLAGVLGILTTASTIAVPVLHRLLEDEREPHDPSDAHGEVATAPPFCPWCGARVSNSSDGAGQLECDTCGGAYRVETSRRPVSPRA